MSVLFTFWGLKLHPCRHILWGCGFAASSHCALNMQAGQGWTTAVTSHSHLSGRESQSGFSILSCRMFFTLNVLMSLELQK